MDNEKRIQEVISRLCKKPGMRARIDAKCADCIYDPLAGGTWRQQIRDCPVKVCPLWDVRTK